jgi:hypothetical protein
MDRKPYGRPFAEPSCLFPSDEEIARVLFGNDKARIKLFEETVAAEERRGLPRKHPTYGARYWPAVKAYFDFEWGLVAEPPFAATTDEGVPALDKIFQPVAPGRRPSRKRAG